MDDPKETPEDVKDLLKEIDRELREIGRPGQNRRITVERTDARVNAVLDRFRTLGISLYDQREEATEL